MKALLIHADFIEWVPTKKAMKTAPNAEKIETKVEEALVVFAAIEKNDEHDPMGVAESAVTEVLKVLGQIHAKKVVVYPYAHLSPSLSKAETAMKVLNALAAGLKKKKLDVYQAPFGWYKAFNLKAKGHPLSELSKEITSSGAKTKKLDDIPEALKKEETLKSQWAIMDTGGKLHKIEIRNGRLKGFDFTKYPNLRKLAMHELAKSRLVKEMPPHIPLMKKLQLVNYEPGSDPGHFRYMPNGKMLKDLIETWTTKKTLEYGALEIETPIMYDYEHPSLKSYLNRFPARQYSIETPNKRVFLRFAACFGGFLMAHDAVISYRNLPLPLYELTRYSFRVEQHGELAGLRRLRAFTMPDCHAFVRNIPQAKSELMKRFKLSIDVQKGFGLGQQNLELAIRLVKDFHENNKTFAMNLVKKWGKPALIEMWDKRFFYFVMKYELNFIDALDKAAALTTDQIDVENAERYGITFMDKDNKKKNPLILHLSPSGAIERIIYALLEKAYMEQKSGKHPVLPMWLSPTQVRLCPVNDSFLKFAEKIAKGFGNKIRVDIDDRSESIGKKIRDAETDWVPLIVVVGEKEKKSGKLAVRFRQTGKVRQMKPLKIEEHVISETRGFPWRPLPMNTYLTKRPVFN